MTEFHIIIQMNILKTWDFASCSFSVFTKLYCHTMMIIDLTFKAKIKRNFYNQTTYIVKVSFFDVSTNINNYLAFNLEGLFGEMNDHWGECPSYNINAYLK